MFKQFHLRDGCVKTYLGASAALGVICLSTATYFCASGSDIIGYAVTHMAMLLLETVGSS